MKHSKAFSGASSAQSLLPQILLFVLVAFFLLPGCSKDEASGQKQSYTTYCNPIDIDYTYSVVNTNKHNSYRSGADPAVVPFRDQYYLFVTRSQGYWHSKDLSNWQFVRPQNWYFESSNAPAAWPMDDSLLIAMGNPAGWQAVIHTADPLKGTWQGAPSLVPFDIHDPDLFVDDDGSVYLYHESSNVHPIKGVELDPDDYFLPRGENRDLIRLHPEQHGWERFGEHHHNTEIAGYLEGAWMNKHDGTYYLQYAAPGTEFSVYGDGVYTSDNPLGPFTYQQSNPFSYKPGGFIRGAGHGSTVRGPYDNYWHFATMVVGINYKFERRIGRFPTRFDPDGTMHANTAYGDYPHYLPSKAHPRRSDWFTGWMLLSYDKPVKSSSHRGDFTASNVVDENIKTFWVAKSNGDEWLTIDLQQPGEIHAVQVNYADYRSNIYGKPDTLYNQYLMEYSDDGQTWHTLVDKRDNRKDEPNDYVELAHPREARYVRFTNKHVPTPNLAISGLRIFGKGSGPEPQTPQRFRADRQEDRREARLSWSSVDDAQGYMIYYGIQPDKLYHSHIVYKDTTLQVSSLNVKPDYWFSIEAFNENGRSARSDTVRGIRDGETEK